MKNLIILMCVTLALSGCYGHKNASYSKVDKASLNTKKVVFYKSQWERRSNAPYSDIVQAGNLFFLSGQVGIDDVTRKLVSGGVAAETRQTLENIKAVLEYHDLSMKNVVKCTVILADINDFSKFNDVYKQYFPQKPARTTFASSLVINAKIEIDCIAAK